MSWGYVGTESYKNTCTGREPVNTVIVVVRTGKIFWRSRAGKFPINGFFLAENGYRLHPIAFTILLKITSASISGYLKIGRCGCSR